MNKRYLITTILINLFLYAAILLSFIFELGNFSWVLDPIVLFNILIFLDSLGFFVGRAILKDNPSDKYARLGFVINSTLIAVYVLVGITEIFGPGGGMFDSIFKLSP